MIFLHFSKKKIIAVSLLFLVILIPLLLGIIFYTDRSVRTKSANQLAGYTELKDRIKSVVTKSNGSKNTIYSRMQKQMIILEDNKKTDKDKYNALVILVFYLKSEYSYTNNHEYFDLINVDAANFAKTHFLKYYDEISFKTSCQDKSCAKNSQHPEIITILEEIKNSDFPPEIKETLTQDLINTGYKNESTARAEQYMILADMVKNGNSYSASGTNIKIADDIFSLVKKHYAQNYEGILKTLKNRNKYEKK